jgi:hypothetical protein
MERQFAKKRLIVSAISISNSFGHKSLQKGQCAPKIICEKFGFINYQKPFSHSIY